MHLCIHVCRIIIVNIMIYATFVLESVTAVSFCTCVDACVSEWIDAALSSNSAYPNCNKCIIWKNIHCNSISYVYLHHSQVVVITWVNEDKW